MLKLFIRAFICGVGFVSGASLTGAIMGYGIGKLAEGAIKRSMYDRECDDKCPHDAHSHTPTGYEYT